MCHCCDFDSWWSRFLQNFKILLQNRQKNHNKQQNKWQWLLVYVLLWRFLSFCLHHGDFIDWGSSLVSLLLCTFFAVCLGLFRMNFEDVCLFSMKWVTISKVIEDKWEILGLVNGIEKLLSHFLVVFWILVHRSQLLLKRCKTLLQRCKFIIHKSSLFEKKSLQTKYSCLFIFFPEILRHISKYLSNKKTPKGAHFCSVLVPLLVKCLVKKHQYYLKQ